MPPPKTPIASKSGQKLSLEVFFTAVQGFGLTTATPLQRAICRIADGQALAELAEHPHVQEALGYHAIAEPLELPTTRPREMIILSGIRTAKSLFVACLALYASQTVDVSKLRPGEVARVSVLSVKKDQARVVYDHLVGTIQANPLLKGLLLEPPTAESVLVRHPSGRPIEICVVPVDRAGASLVARWSAGCILDEAPRMQGQEDGVINYDDARKAVLLRLLPGAQLVSVGSPWAPFGPIYNRVQEHWGKPTKELVILKAPGPYMNPFWWTPERVEDAKADPAVYRTDVLAEFADQESTLFTTDMIEACVSREYFPIPADGTCKGGWRLTPSRLSDYVGAMDPATRGNAWPFVLLTRDKEGRKVVALTMQWHAGKGGVLDPERVIERISQLCHEYGVEVVYTDQYSADALRAIARRYNLHVVPQTTTASSNLENFENMRTDLLGKQLVVPPDATLRADLLAVKKRVTQGGVKIHLPKTGDGRHADYAPTLALAASKNPELPSPPPFAHNSFEEIQAKAAERRAAVFARTERREEKPWWEGT